MATVHEAIDALTQLGFPKQQLNERSGLVLLALLDLTPDKPWREATAPLRGITPMMDHMAQHYGKTYAPNSRETVRRQTVHQFLEGGLILQNPDRPDRPVNSGKTTYQVNSVALDLLRSYGSKDWALALRRYQLTSHGPVDAKRHEELQRLFAGSAAGLVFVTSFLDRRTLARYLGDISWETEVWVAESPTHLIHFNGDRFLGPHK